MPAGFDDLLPGESPFDISHLLVPEVGSRAQLSVIEGRQIFKVLRKYFNRKGPIAEVVRFDYPWLVGLHREMYEGVWGWAGQFRTENLNLGVPYHQIQERLYNLVDDMAAWGTSGMDPIEQAARFHHRAVEIHPFPNGNGRWARLATNIWLALRGLPIVQWPEDLIGSSSRIRDEYINALKAADRGDFEALTAMHQAYGTDLVRPPVEP
jgi:Fic-DOC domain mobile mystery protein B